MITVIATRVMNWKQYINMDVIEINILMRQGNGGEKTIL